MTQITFPVPAIKFGKSDAELILRTLRYGWEGPFAELTNEDHMDLDAIEDALNAFLKAGDA